MTSFFQQIPVRFDAFLQRFEVRFGLKAASVFAAALLMLAAALVSSPRLTLEYHGLGFTRLSLAPLDFSVPNDLRYRILSPLTGYLLFFRGALFKYYMLLVTAAFLAFVYYTLRKRSYVPLEALGITALLAFSTLLFYQYYFPGYNDPFSYLLLSVLLFTERKFLRDLLLVLLMLLNHENVLFLFPFFLLLRMDNDPSLESFLRACGFLTVVVAPYMSFRHYVSVHSPVDFTVDYYFDEGNLDWTRRQLTGKIPEGIFQAFRLFWIFPLMAFFIDLRKRNFSEPLLLLALVAGVTAQFYIAYDVSRLMGLAFPALLIGAMRVRETLGTRKFLPLLWALIFINFFVPAWCIGALDPIYFGPWWLR